MGKYFYNLHQAGLRKILRKNTTFPEQRLWARLKNRQLKNIKFRRQASVGRYVADFYSPEIKLVIEIDGDSHSTQAAEAYDKEREEFMGQLGLRTVRFTNRDVMENMEGVVTRLMEIVEEIATDSPLPA